MPRRTLTPLLALILVLSLLPACSVSIGTKPAPPAPAPTAAPTARTERATIQGLNLRQGPSSKSASLGSLDKDEAVLVLERQGNWIRVRTADGREGFAYGAYLTGFDIRPARPRSGKAAASDPATSKTPQDISPEEEQELWN